MKVSYVKYDALGNTYVVIDPRANANDLSQADICDICRALASDGLLVGPSFSSDGIPSVRIFNPDGSEAEKSGNGVRIFAKYLYDRKDITADTFSLNTKGGLITIRRNRADATSLTLGLGKLSFHGTHRFRLNDRDDTSHVVDIGNPHCVLIVDHASEDLARTHGPLIETDPIFPDRTNVQFVEVLDRTHIKLFIWERGAGYTLSSGTSSAAAAGVCHHIGLCDPIVHVEMPGGAIEVRLEGSDVEITGDVRFVGAGEIEV